MEIFIAFIIIPSDILISKRNTRSKDNRHLQEEPKTPKAFIEKLTTTISLYEGETSFISEHYLTALGLLFFCILVSKPTVSIGMLSIFGSVRRRSPEPNVIKQKNHQ